MKDNSFSKDDFQIINMNYKLKKIKNRKKRGQYKKNDLFETLDNTTKPEQDGATSFLPSFSSENVVEPFELPPLEFPPYTDDDYDGIDNVDDTGAKVDFQYDPREWLIALIEWIYYYLNSFNNYLASKIVNILSEKTGQESDVKLVRNYIAWTEAIAAGCYVVYNWFFIIYFHRTLDPPIKLFTIDFKKEFENAEMNKDKGTAKEIWYSFLIIVHYFFDYPFTILFFLNMFVTELLPKYTEKIFPASFLFVFLFYQSCLFLKNCALVVKHLFINSVLFKFDPSSIIIYMVIIILWGKDLVLKLKKVLEENGPKKPGADGAPEDGPPPPKTPPMVLAGLLLGTLLERLLKLIMLLIIGIPATTLAVVTYFLAYSFFGIFIYKGFNTKTFHDIDSYVKIPLEPYIPDICDGYHWYDFLYEIFNIVMMFFDTLQGKLFTITFMLLYAISCYDYSANITPDTKNLKNGLLGINIGLIITLLSMVGSYFFEKMKGIPEE